mmetsp:Transcript_23058/g.22204  ORF Transcript_23058/g.22204 Transcript_23058/m.22204 type:complete len:222 (+) Transcript_23058:731-1396(+)
MSKGIGRLLSMGKGIGRSLLDKDNGKGRGIKSSSSLSMTISLDLFSLFSPFLTPPSDKFKSVLCKITDSVPLLEDSNLLSRFHVIAVPSARPQQSSNGSWGLQTAVRMLTFSLSGYSGALKEEPGTVITHLQTACSGITSTSSTGEDALSTGEDSLFTGEDSLSTEEDALSTGGDALYDDEDLDEDDEEDEEGSLEGDEEGSFEDEEGSLEGDEEGSLEDK